MIDLDLYRREPFINDMGRLVGSTRFMAPEELERGATIDERTTVFTMGRAVQIFVDCEIGSYVDVRRALLDVAERACQTHPTDRWQRMADFYAAWRQATASVC